MKALQQQVAHIAANYALKNDVAEILARQAALYDEKMNSLETQQSTLFKIVHELSQRIIDLDKH